MEKDLVEEATKEFKLYQETHPEADTEMDISQAQLQVRITLKYTILFVVITSLYSSNDTYYNFSTYSPIAHIDNIFKVTKHHELPNCPVGVYFGYVSSETDDIVVPDP